MTTLARGAWRRGAGWLLRTSALGLVVTAVFSRLGAAGTDQARDEMMAVGGEMLRMPEPPQAGAGDRVLLNGAELEVSRGHTPQDVDQLLAAAEASCTRRAAGATPFRGGGGERGFVACLDPSADPERGLIERAGAAASGAMTVPIAYVYAERRGGATHFIRFRSAEPVDLRALFPRDADAPGPDNTALPRPRSSRRALGLRVAGQPYEAAVYLDREQKLDDLVAHYRGALPGAGWTVVAPWRVDEGPGPRQASVFIERAGALAMLVVAQDRADLTTTTLMTMEANHEQ